MHQKPLCSVCCFSLNRLYSSLGPSDTKIHILIEKSFFSPSDFAYNERNSLMLYKYRSLPVCGVVCKCRGDTNQRRSSTRQCSKEDRFMLQYVAVYWSPSLPPSQRCFNTKFRRRKHLLLPHQTMPFHWAQSFTRITSTFCSKNYFNLK